jgi:Sec-independent protein translocase protein TatA
MGKGLGEGMRGFKQAISGETPAQPTQISLAKVDEQPVAAAQTTTEQQTPVA